PRRPARPSGRARPGLGPRPPGKWPRGLGPQRANRESLVLGTLRGFQTSRDELRRATLAYARRVMFRHALYSAARWPSLTTNGTSSSAPTAATRGTPRGPAPPRGARR